LKAVKNITAKMALNSLRRKCEPREIALPDDIISVRNVLVCLPPVQRELTMIKQLLPDLSKVFLDAEIYLLASPGRNVYDIFPRKGYRIMSPTSEQISWSGIASKKYIATLKKNKYDMILDFNLRPNIFTQSILLSFPESLKIGKGNSLGSPYYNIEIKTKFIRDEKNIYKSILETIDSFKKNKSVNN